MFSSIIDQRNHLFGNLFGLGIGMMTIDMVFDNAEFSPHSFGLGNM
jgi:hypothetical protein